MTRIHLVRHGRASAGWDRDPDPGLDAVGELQARSAAELLASRGPLRLVSSPLRRCRETAEPLAALWGSAVEIVPAVAEIPSPDGVPMEERVEWLRAAMRGTWADLGARYTAFRDGVAAAVASMPDDTVVFSHFIAINAVIGSALGDDRLVIRSLDNCSITIVDVIDGALHLVEGGHEADTLIR
jgi:broad specificity phosphatase PhoE